MKKLIPLLFLFTLLLWPLGLKAAELKGAYPRLANYFLKWEISNKEAVDLSKWDLLVLDMEVQENSPEAIRLIRSLNPNIIILAYITSQEIIANIDSSTTKVGTFLRSELNSEIIDGWWLKDKDGNRISNWPYTYMFNLSDGAKKNNSGYRFNDYLPEFIAENIGSKDFFDGVFYDNTWGDIYWINSGNLDLNNNGSKDGELEANTAWANGFKKMLEKTRSLLGEDFIIAGNGRIFEDYQKIINGMMLESFPSSWENGGTWSGSMSSYSKYSSINKYPQIPIINVGEKSEENYQSFRFGLTSTLLGDGFYSFDYGTTNHTQLWYYDEYDVNLGPAKGVAYNILDADNSTFQPGLWRRDFKFGSIFVNSTNKDQLHIFKKEEFDKIKGTQDKLTNNGQKINYIKLPAEDGLVVLKKSNSIVNSAFVNGYFYRVFNLRGEQVRNGYFSFINTYPAGEQVIIANGDKSDVEDVNVSSQKGKVTLNKNGRSLASFYPYDNLFRKQVNLAADINNGYFNLLAIGTTAGGGPQVRVFSPDGQLKSSFFAYNKNLRSGVSVAVGDINNDGNLEIITGPGKGEKPEIRIFTLSGDIIHRFLAYDEKFKGGVDVAVGDLNNDGSLEIITGPGQGGGPHVRVFNARGEVLSQFFAYDKNYCEGLKISISDTNDDGKLEILAGIKNIY